VASEVGALRDLIVNDVTEYLVPRRNPRELANAINVLLRDAFLRQSFGAAGRDRAAVRYSWNRIADDLQRVYRHLASTSYPRATPA
jgi:D-inositol-3-phosphate glycosyltransferase